MTPPLRRRTRARELALQFLYTLELRGMVAMEDLDPFVEHHTHRDPDRKGRPEIAAYTLELVHGVQDKLPELNLWIERIAANWRLERMAHVDRNILRLAMYELLYRPDVPFKVVINEAIDIAKRYSTAQSGAFVNGILDRAQALIAEQRELGATDFVPPSPRAAAPARRSAPSFDPLREAPVPVPRPSHPHPRPGRRPPPAPPASPPSES